MPAPDRALDDDDPTRRARDRARSGGHDHGHGHGEARDPARARARAHPLALLVPVAALALSVAVVYVLGARFAVLAGVLAAAALAHGAARSRLGQAALVVLLCPLPAAALWAHKRDETRARPVERAIALEHEADRRLEGARSAEEASTALRRYEEATRLWPSFVGLHKLGAARWRTGDQAGALASFARALEAPDRPADEAAALYERGLASLRAGEVERGWLALELAVQASHPMDGVR